MLPATFHIIRYRALIEHGKHSTKPNSCSPRRMRCRSASREGLDCYTRLVSISGPFVVSGAGNLGRRVARAIDAKLFCDNNSRLWGTSINGIRVESAASAARQFPDATFVVAIWNPSRTETMLDRMEQLRSTGAKRVIPFTELFDDYGDRLLPHFLWARKGYYKPHEVEIAKGRALLDAEGRAEFDRQLRLRLGDFQGQVIDPAPQFFATELGLTDKEVFIDCGAYDGDTVQLFRQAVDDRFESIVAFEPDPVNLAALRQSVDSDPRVVIHPFAVGSRRDTVHFTIAGTGSHVAEDGDCEVQVVSLDETLQGCHPTYIKMDIEGSELDALEGAKESIRLYRPKLAVCVYHLPDHLWKVPIKVHELLPDSELTLRTYNADGFECVCYCIPH